MPPRHSIGILLPFVFACETNLTSLADNPEDLTDVQIQELINSSGMSQIEAAALEEEIHALLDECLDGNDDACDELSDIIEELEDDSEDDSSEDHDHDGYEHDDHDGEHDGNHDEDDSEDDSSEEDDSEEDDDTAEEVYSPEIVF